MNLKETQLNVYLNLYVYICISLKFKLSLVKKVEMESSEIKASINEINS